MVVLLSLCVCPLLTHAKSFPSSVSVFFFFNDTATTEIYTLSLHDALPISPLPPRRPRGPGRPRRSDAGRTRSEEHTSELQSPQNLVCRLLLEKNRRARWSISARSMAISAYRRKSSSAAPRRPSCIIRAA